MFISILTDFSQQLHKLNLQMQGKKKKSLFIEVSDWLGKKLLVLKNLTIENKLIHFPCWEVIKLEFDDEINYEYCISYFDEITVEFK
jgi:hypothetical protein